MEPGAAVGQQGRAWPGNDASVQASGAESRGRVPDSDRSGTSFMPWMSCWWKSRSFTESHEALQDPSPGACAMRRCILGGNRRLPPGTQCLISVRPAVGKVQPCIPQAQSKGQGPESRCHIKAQALGTRRVCWGPQAAARPAWRLQNGKLMGPGHVTGERGRERDSICVRLILVPQAWTDQALLYPNQSTSPVS